MTTGLWQEDMVSLLQLLALHRILEMGSVEASGSLKWGLWPEWSHSLILWGRES